MRLKLFLVSILCIFLTSCGSQTPPPKLTKTGFKHGLVNAFNTIQRPGTTSHIERIQCVHHELDSTAKCGGVAYLSDGTKAQFLLTCPTIPGHLCVIKGIGPVPGAPAPPPRPTRAPWERDGSA